MASDPTEPPWPEGATERLASVHPIKPEEPPPKRAPLDWQDLATKQPPERRWAIRGWLGFDHVTLMVGSGGIGKTLLAQQMASCLSLARPFIGEVPEPLTCLMWACEDDHDELWRRQVQIARWCNAGLEAFAERLVIVPRHGLDNAIAVSSFGRLAFTPLLLELSEQANDLKSECVILDNVGQLYGAGENDRHAVTAFLNALSGALPGRALLLLAHPSRSIGSEFSGSSAWENVVRTRLYLGAKLPGEKPDPDAEPQDDNIRYLARRKSNYSDRDWRKFTFKDGALTQDEAAQAGGVVATIRASNAEQAVLNGLKKLQEMHIRATEGTRSPQYLPRLLSEYKLLEGHERTEIGAAMRRLLVEGRLHRVIVGKYGSNRTPMHGLSITDTTETPHN